jgi:hypothetical protein
MKSIQLIPVEHKDEKIEMLIFFICPCPEGCEENQFAPFRDGAKS